MLEGQVEVVFVNYFPKTKSGRTMLRLSNGVEAQFFNTTVTPDDVNGIGEGDSVNVTIEIDPFNPFKTKITSVDKL